MPLPSLNVWTKPSGYNLGHTPGWGVEVAVGNLIIGREYIIKDVGTSDFTTIGARANTANVLFTATSTGSRAGPFTGVEPVSHPGTGTVYEAFIREQNVFNQQLPTAGDGVITLQIANAGTGYPINGGSFYTTGGHGTGMTVQVFSPSGYLQAVSINNPGVGYQDGDIVTILAGGNNATVVVNIDFLVTYSVISGKLPPGLRISGNRLIGTPFEVADYTLFTFCIRASKSGYSISDRTFSILVDGPDLPIFVTETGSIPIGVHEQLYVLDKTYVNFQIEAFDLDTAVGQKLTYFISSGDGNLPPGVTMTSDGFISGYILPAPKIKPNDGAGTYDEGYYDAASYDFALRPTNGFDSYVYDQVFYDYNLPYTRPSSLNVNYQFKVTVTDGNNYAQRIFKIFVVGDDQFRADTTTSDGFASGLFTADVTYLRQPAWLTNSNIGLFRANNYLTIPIILYDNSNVYYKLEYINQEVTCTSINVSPIDNIKNSNFITVTNVKGTILPNYYIVFDGIIEGATGQLYRIAAVSRIDDTDQYRLYVVSELAVDIPNGTSFYIGSKSTLPAGTLFDLQTATVYGAVPYQPAITKNYNFTITAIRLGDKGDSARTSRTFTIGIIGEIDSVITWNSDSNLGTINANLVSTLNVSASSTITDAVVQYKLINGKLPPGLTLNSDGEIVGKVSQFYNATTGKLGLTRFYDQPPQVPTKVFTTFDNDTSTFDKKYVFTIQAKDQYDYSATTRQFTILILTPNSIGYSNVRTHPFLKQSQRLSWKSFINDNSIFTPSSIYRTNDNNFGIQVNLNMLVYAGIETKSAAEYISAIALNHKRKRFAFGAVKSASAIIPGTNSTAYEVVYIEMKDLAESNGKHLPRQIKFNGSADSITSDNSMDFWSRSITVLESTDPRLNRPNPILTIDSTGYQASNSNTNVYFPNSISLWRQQLKAIGSTERNYLPLWMRSIQPGTKEELGFVLAVPICYCKAGTSADIVLNITHSGFDFKTLDYTADRYIIDAVDDLSIDKYLIFRNDRITV